MKPFSSLRKLRFAVLLTFLINLNGLKKKNVHNISSRTKELNKNETIRRLFNSRF